jgi:hypothetical protein
VPLPSSHGAIVMPPTQVVTVVFGTCARGVFPNGLHWADAGAVASAAQSRAAQHESMSLIVVPPSPMVVV